MSRASAPSVPLFLCRWGKDREVLCGPCADEAAYGAAQRTPWTVDAWSESAEDDGEGRGRLKAGPSSCQQCGAGDLAADARAEQDARDAQREAR